MLSREAPTHGDGADSCTIDFQATTGFCIRWRTQDGVTRVFYGDRAGADTRLLTYTSAPLTEDLEIIGHSAVTLYVAFTATDKDTFARIPDGGAPTTRVQRSTPRTSISRSSGPERTSSGVGDPVPLR